MGEPRGGGSGWTATQSRGARSPSTSSWPGSTPAGWSTGTASPPTGGPGAASAGSPRTTSPTSTRLLALYEQERDKLVGVARRRLGTYAQDAEDVLQEVMRKLCQHPPKLREPGKLTSYVYTSLYNETATWATRAAGERGRRAADDETADVPDRRAAFDETVVFHIVLARALAGLSPRERQMIELVDIRRLTEREAAERLGISLGAAKSYRHGARVRLREDPGLAQLRTVA